MSAEVPSIEKEASFREALRNAASKGTDKLKRSELADTVRFGLKQTIDAISTTGNMAVGTTLATAGAVVENIPILLIFAGIAGTSALFGTDIGLASKIILGCVITTGGFIGGTLADLAYKEDPVVGGVGKVLFDIGIKVLKEGVVNTVKTERRDLTAS